MTHLEAKTKPAIPDSGIESLVSTVQQRYALTKPQATKVSGHILEFIAAGLDNGSALTLTKTGADGLPTELKVLELVTKEKDQPQIKTPLLSSLFKG